MQLPDIKKLVKNDLEQVNSLIYKELHTQVPIIQEIGKYIINSGGKRLRPLLVLLAAKANNYNGTDHIAMAVAIEFIHTATLLHDDVVDNTNVRRSKKTANANWNNSAAILVGDFLYSRAFQIMVKVGQIEILQILANATNTIAEGEVMQLINQHNPQASEDNYLKIVTAKTATLFAAACELCAVFDNNNLIKRQILSQYGKNLGIAFQLIDDLLDYSADPEDLGKSLGNDLQEGKPTLPLIRLLQVGPIELQQDIKAALINKTNLDFNAIQSAISNTDSIEYTANLAKNYALKAQQAAHELAPSNYKDALFHLAEFVVARSF